MPNEPTIEELREWSARELMGWEDFDGYYGRSIKSYIDPPPTPVVICTKEDSSFGSGWRPDDPTTGQIWLVVEKMIQEGWRFGLWSNGPDEFGAEFYKGRTGNPTAGAGAFDPNHCLAILKAAKAAREAAR